MRFHKPKRAERKLRAIGDPVPRSLPRRFAEVPIHRETPNPRFLIMRINEELSHRWQRKPTDRTKVSQLTCFIRGSAMPSVGLPPPFSNSRVARPRWALRG
jgi:hypothetical protein